MQKYITFQIRSGTSTNTPYQHDTYYLLSLALTSWGNHYALNSFGTNQFRRTTSR
uniref:Uncharacterized protein n=1 Tax=Solanum tuberosum TaxID=4113 RepID=M1BPN4_SOLTU